MFGLICILRLVSSGIFGCDRVFQRNIFVSETFFVKICLKKNVQTNIFLVKMAHKKVVKICLKKCSNNNFFCQDGTQKKPEALQLMLRLTFHADFETFQHPPSSAATHKQYSEYSLCSGSAIVNIWNIYFKFAQKCREKSSLSVYIIRFLEFIVKDMLPTPKRNGTITFGMLNGGRQNSLRIVHLFVTSPDFALGIKKTNDKLCLFRIFSETI